MSKGLIYLIGILPFGFFYYRIKGMMGDVQFFIVAIFYLLILRLCAEKLGRPK
jgi:hypothetical protein